MSQKNSFRGKKMIDNEIYWTGNLNSTLCVKGNVAQTKSPLIISSAQVHKTHTFGF